MEQRDGFEKHDVSFKRPKVDTFSNLVRRDVHAIMRVRGKRQKEVFVDEVITNIIRRENSHDRAQSGSFLQLKHRSRNEQDHKRHEFPKPIRRRDCAQKQVPRRPVIKWRQFG